MRIIINATTLNHPIRNGLLVYTENLINKLAEIDKNNEYFLLFTSMKKKPSQMPGPVQGNFIKKILRIPDRNFFYKRAIMDKIVLPLYLKRIHSDIYHAPAGHSLGAINGAKTILTMHDLRSLTIPDKNLPQDIKSLKKAVNQVDICITVSETTKNDILRYFNVSADKIKIVYLGVDERFKPIEHKTAFEYVKAKYQIKQNFFFSLGQVPRKNIPRLIKAFNIFKYNRDFLLVIGGAGNVGPWAREYRKLVDKLSLQDRIRFLGYIPVKIYLFFIMRVFALFFLRSMRDLVFLFWKQCVAQRLLLLLTYLLYQK